MIKCKNPNVSTWFCLKFLFACTILDGRLYTIVKLIWKLIQSRIVPTLVLVDICWFGKKFSGPSSRIKRTKQTKRANHG